MKRRDFSLALGAAVTANVLLQSPALAQTKAPEAGTDYQMLEKPAPVEAPAGKVEVVEFFGYFCPHCSHFEPAFDAWRKRAPKDLSIRRVPIAFNDAMVPQQRLYYALEAMGLVDQLHAKVFAAIHQEKQNLSTADLIAAWVAKQGVDTTQFLAHYNSFTVNTKATRATQLQNAYRIEGVPALGVAGRFWTDGGMAKGMDRALQVVDFLAARVRAGK
jgi:thiol:disulfide interchange protein DsbA